MEFPKLQLGLKSGYGAFNGNVAYVEGSTAEKSNSVIQFFGLPINRTVEELAEMPDCAEALAFAQYAVAAINEAATLRAQVAALVAAGEMCIVELKDWMKSNGEDLDTLHAIQTAEAAIAAAERSAG